MKYNFDKIHSRKNTNSLKWDTLQERYGDSDLLPLWVADMDFQAPGPVIDKLTAIARSGIYGYSAKQETYSAAIRSWMKTRHNWQIKSDWITFSPGVVPAINMLVQAYTQPGDKIIIQQPVYYPFMSSITGNSRIISNNQLIETNGTYQINFDDLKVYASDPMAKLFILCSPHNPVGRVWTKAELERIAEICLKNDIIVIADEIHADLVFEGHKHIPFASLSDEINSRTVTCTSPSKTFNLAGLQVSNIIIENTVLRNKYLSVMHRIGIYEMNIFAISAVEAAYTRGGEWLDQLLCYLWENYLLVKERIERGLAGVKVFPLEGTYLAWIDCRSLSIHHKELEKVLMEKGRVALSQGYVFGKCEGAGFIRINIACPRQLLKQGLDNIISALVQFTH